MSLNGSTVSDTFGATDSFKFAIDDESVNLDEAIA